MKSIKKIIMIGVMTLASLSTVIYADQVFQAFDKGDLYIGYGDNQNQGHPELSVRCPLYNTHGTLEGYQDSMPDANGFTHSIVLTKKEKDGFISETGRLDVSITRDYDLANIVPLTGFDPNFGDPFKAFPELNSLSSAERQSYALLIVSGNHSQSDTDGLRDWDATGKLEDKTHISIRCVYLIDLSGGPQQPPVFKKCLKCMFFVS